MADDTITNETLSDGLTSPFWEWFGRHAEREWGPAGLRYQQAVKDASERPDAVVELQKVLHTQQAILSLLRHPAEELQRRRQQTKQAFMAGNSRRGPGL